MTVQIDDIFILNDTDYSVAGISEGKLFHPSMLGLRPSGTCSACWRGYQAIYAVSDSRLTLDTLHVDLLTEGDEMLRQEGPSINGVTPTGPQENHDWFNNHYTGLGYHLEYTGGLLLADGFIDNLYIDMGFHPAWKYTRVLELIFKNGIFQKEFDRSDRMTEVRQKILNADDDRDTSQMLSNDEIRRSVERSFDRSYNR